MKALTVAWFEVVDAMRSRRAVATLVLYLAGCVVSAVVFLRIIGEIEKVAAKPLMVAETKQAGAMTGSLMQSSEFRDFVTNITGDASLVDTVIALPPLALLYGWVCLSLLPLLVMVTSVESITAEVQSGEARYTLVRTDRWTWALGKFLGQGVLMSVGISLGAVGVWVVGWFMWASFDGLATAWWMLRLVLRCFCYGMCWLGLAMGISQITTSVAWVRAMGLLSLVGMAVTAGLLAWDRGGGRFPALAESLLLLLPSGHELRLWHPDPVIRGGAAAMLVALGLVYFTLGHQRLARRDL